MRGPGLSRARPPVAHAVFVVGVTHVALRLLQLRVVDPLVDLAMGRRLVRPAAPAEEQPGESEQQRRTRNREGDQTSRFRTNLAFSSMNLRRGSTSSPISVSNSCDASRASSIVTLSSVRLGGSIVVSRS
jgi:hypothetical protein